PDFNRARARCNDRIDLGRKSPSTGSAWSAGAADRRPAGHAGNSGFSSQLAVLAGCGGGICGGRFGAGGGGGGGGGGGVRGGGRGAGGSGGATPGARGPAPGAGMSSPRQQALVAVSAVPVVLWVTTSRLPPPQPKVRNCSSSSSTSSPSVPA